MPGNVDIMLNGIKVMSKYQYQNIQLIKPEFDSSLTDLIIELDYLRKRKLGGTTHPYVFFQLKSLFHTLESIGSARIEGNHTTVAEFIEAKLAKGSTWDEKINEIKNVEKSMEFIDQTITDNNVNEAYIRELHKKVVLNLNPGKEGDSLPGEFRKSNVKITGSKHVPPEFMQVKDYMEELMRFMESDDSPKYDLLKIALFHHRFVWIHPFGNGNGRSVRLITYAQLVKHGFNVHIGHIVNPTAIFCSDRDKYNAYLAKADTGEMKQLLIWCEYVLRGLKSEIEKIDKLLDYGYLSKEILLPSVQDSLDHKIITPTEAEILKIAVAKQKFQASDLRSVFPGKIPAHISREIAKLKEKKMIVSDSERQRSYLLNFETNYLLRSVIRFLDKGGFLPLKGET